MSLLNYWPTAEEINLCVNHEAEGAHDAVLLAVHQPSPLSYRQVSSDQKREASEDDLFEYLITKDVPSGSHVVPITGASGVGKSHTVRILAARLHSMNEDGRYVIIRIPKSASLRRVVELILEKLPGDDYAKVKTEFAKALDAVTVDSAAVINFQSQLDIALQGLARQLQDKVRANPGSSGLKEQLGHALKLSRFMGDPILVDYFRSEIFPRIVRRALAGHSQSELEVRVEDFLPEDFLLPESIDVTKAAETTRSYYALNLSIREGEGRRTVARLLNESTVVDQAIRQLFKLHESIGGMTLQDVILEIRRLLLKQDRELVILVEDFKALTGIQDTLLNVLIQEGVRDGLRELATMRSVIAVTDGYLAGKDTIATRAKREWVVESTLSSDGEVLRRTKALVASYLNAARWGYRGLVHHFEKNGVSRNAQGEWIGPYVDHHDSSDAPVLNAFGKSGEIPFFPYTEQAIEQLARATLSRKEVLVFTPRFIIDNILRGLLLPGRPAFEREQFPPPDITAPTPNALVSEWLAGLQVSDDVRGRYRRLVGIWGNDPSTTDEIGYIPKEVFDAFSLKRPDLKFSPAPPPKEQVKDPKRPQLDKPVDDVLTQELESWIRNQERLPQNTAMPIRHSIASALNERIDWSTERVLKLPIKANEISIPNAGGQAGISTAAIIVADDLTDPSGLLRQELAAVTRFHHTNKGKIQYSGVDDDLVLIANLVDRLMPQALALMRARAREKLGIAVRLLSTNSRILGLLERGRTPASLANFLFGSPSIFQRPPEEAPMEFSSWCSMQEQALRIRPELIQLVAAHCGSFQGIGKTPFAIDMMRVADGLLPEEKPTDLNSLELSPDFKRVLQEMSEVRVKSLARRVSQGAKNIRTKLIAELGGNFDKQEIATEFRALADQLKETGQWNEPDIGMGHLAFKNQCEAFRSSPLREALSILASSEEGEDGQDEGNLISRIGRFDVHPLIVASRFVETARRVIRASEKRAKVLEDQFQGVDPMAQASEIQILFQSLLTETDALAAEGETSCS